MMYLLRYWIEGTQQLRVIDCATDPRAIYHPGGTFEAAKELAQALAREHETRCIIYPIGTLDDLQPSYAHDALDH